MELEEMELDPEQDVAPRRRDTENEGVNKIEEHPYEALDSSLRRLRPNCIHLSSPAVGELSTEDVKTLVRNLAPDTFKSFRRIEWIDDTRLVVVYENDVVSTQAMKNMVQDDSDFATITEQLQRLSDIVEAGGDYGSEDLEILLRERVTKPHPSRPFKKLPDDISILVNVRFALTSDVKARDAASQSTWYARFGPREKERTRAEGNWKGSLMRRIRTGDKDELDALDAELDAFLSGDPEAVDSQPYPRKTRQPRGTRKAPRDSRSLSPSRRSRAIEDLDADLDRYVTGQGLEDPDGRQSRRSRRRSRSPPPHRRRGRTGGSDSITQAAAVGPDIFGPDFRPEELFPETLDSKSTAEQANIPIGTSVDLFGAKEEEHKASLRGWEEE